jgi:Tol biopolymer transport system component
MIRLLVVLLLLNLWVANGAMLPSPGQADFATGAIAIQSREIPPMRLRFGVPTSSGAQAFITDISADGIASLVEVPYGSVSGEFSFDGRQVAYDNCGDRLGRPHGIYVNNLADHTSRRIFTIKTKLCFQVRWAPDGERVSFFSHEDSRIHIVNIASDEVTTLPNIQVGSQHWWSPKGDQIVIERARGLFVTDLEGHERQLAHARDFNGFVPQAPTWSRDGSLIACSTDEGRRKRLYTIAADGSEIKRFETPNTVYSPRWSTDSEWIIFRCDDQLIQVHRDGSGLKLIGEFKNYGADRLSSPFSLGPKH